MLHSGKRDVAKKRLARQPNHDIRVFTQGPQHGDVVEAIERLAENINALAFPERPDGPWCRFRLKWGRCASEVIMWSGPSLSSATPTSMAAIRRGSLQVYVGLAFSIGRYGTPSGLVGHHSIQEENWINRQVIPILGGPKQDGQAIQRHQRHFPPAAPFQNRYKSPGSRIIPAPPRANTKSVSVTP